MKRKINVKKLIKKIVLGLAMAVTVILPVALVEEAPVKVAAADPSTQYSAIMSADVDTLSEALEVSATLTYTSVGDAELPYMMNKLETLIKAEYPDEYSAKSGTNYAAFLVEYNRMETNYMNGYLTGTHTSGETTYVVGNNSAVKGIGAEGFYIKGGHVIFEAASKPMYFDGPIVVSGGKLTIRLKEGAGYNTFNTSTGGAIIKRASKNSLRNSEDYIPMNASDDIVTQYSGALFYISGGEVEIVGGYWNESTQSYTYLENDRRIYISGTGQHSGGNASTASGGGFVFPANGTTTDDIQASGPIFYIDDESGSTSVTLDHVSLRHNLNMYFNSKSEEEPYVSTMNVNKQYDYTTTSGRAATYGKTKSPVTYQISGGGIVFSGKSPTLTMNNSDITDCYSKNSSAAIHVATTVGGMITLNNTVILSNFTHGADVNTGATIRAMGSNRSSMSITNCQFKDNWTQDAAAAIQWGSMQTEYPLTISGSTFSNNVSYKGCGAIVCNSRLEIESTTISGNTSVTGNGGAINFSSWVSATDNKTFELRDDADLRIGNGVEIKENKAKSGAGIYISASLIVTGANFKTSDPSKYRTFPEKGYYDANGVFQPLGTYSMSLYIETGAVIQNNVSSSVGGAVYMTKNANCEYDVKTNMEGGEIKNNRSTSSDGGAFYLTGNGVDFIMSGGEISNNGYDTSTGTATTTNGGGVYVNTGGNFYMSGSGKIYSNKASDNGGGVYVNGGNFEMTGGDIYSNKALGAAGDGGGVCLNGGNFEMSEGDIYKNTAGQYGGGVSVYNGTFSMTGGTIGGESEEYANSASKNGGGVAVWGTGADFKMSGGYIKYNACDTSGGGVYVSSGDFKMYKGEDESGDGGEISFNTTVTRGGGVFVDGGNFQMDVGLITSNSSTNDIEYNTNCRGGGVSVLNGNFTMNGGTISKNMAIYRGGGVEVDGGTFLMTGGMIGGDTSDDANYTTSKVKNNSGAVEIGIGGGVCVWGNSDFIMTGGKIKYNKTEAYGGAVYVSGSAGANFRMYKGEDGKGTGGEISYNYGKTRAGGVYVYEGLFKMDAGLITQNYCKTHEGGAVWVYKGQFEMTGGTISENYTQNATNGNGGAIAVTGTGAAFDMSGGTISSNTSAASGGAVYLETGDFNLTGGSIINNNAAQNGGAVYVNLGNFAMSGTVQETVISGNSTLKHGGAVYVYGNGTKGDFTMNGGIITDNHATEATSGDLGGKGGAVCVNLGTFTMNDGEISSNTCGREGGAVFVNGNITYGKFFMKGGVIHSNSTVESLGGRGGGAIYLWQASFDMTAGTIRDNTSIGSGAAVNVAYGDFKMSSGTISGNVSNAHGGAVYVAGGKFEMSGGDIKNNYSLGYGGAVYVTPHAMNDTTLYTASFTMSGGTLEGNGIDKDGTVHTTHGGAVFVSGGSFTMKGGTLRGNAATTSGGAVYVRTITVNTTVDKVTTANVCTGSFTMDETVGTSNISYNYASGDGGAIYVESGDFRMDGGTIEYNGTEFTIENEEYKEGDIAAENGGAIYVNLGNFTMTAGTITHNKSLAEGGAVYVKGGNSKGIFTMDGGTLSYNHANGYGGAVNVHLGTFRMTDDDCYISYNTSDKSGGAVQVVSGSFTMDEGTVNNNSAPNESGGAVFVNNGSFTMNGGNLTANSCETNGGAVALSGGNFIMTDGTISLNTACWGGGVYVNGGNFTMSKGTISGNYNTTKNGASNELQGGAVFVNGENSEKGIFTMNGGTIENNGINGSTVATKKGGAVYIHHGNFIMNENTAVESIIRGNKARNDGGAVYVYWGNFQMTGGEVSANLSSANGGAVYVEGNGEDGEALKGKFQMSGGSITGNGFDTSSGDAVTQNGGGVYVKDGSFTMNGTALISENKTKYQGAGVYVNGGDVYINGGEIDSNSAGSFGGGVSVSGGGKITMTAGAISGNKTEKTYTESTGNGNSGAGVYVADNGEFLMQGGEIKNNVSNASGGAVRVGTNGTFTIESGKIYGNSCNDSGGAIFMIRGTCYIKGGEIYENTCGVNGGGSGGAINVTGGTCYIQGGDIYDNTSTSDGGAICLSGYTDDNEIYHEGNVEMTGGTIRDNIADDDGGGIYITDGNFHMTEGTISGNEAYDMGGGICIGTGSARVDGGTIKANTAATLGGGVYISTGDFIMFGGNIGAEGEANVAVDGGGVYVNSGDFSMSGGTIAYNTASNSGAGVYVNSGNLRISPSISPLAEDAVEIVEGIIENNAATVSGGGIYVASGEVYMANGAVRNNTAVEGGGVYLADGTFEMSGGAICSNNAKDGAGIYIGKGTLNINTGDAEISSNTASEYGGGVLVEDGTVNMETGSIKSNHSDSHGGGAFMVKGTINLSGTAEITLNTSGHFGAGVYLSSGTFNMDGGSITNNDATNTTQDTGRGGGVYLESGSFIMDAGTISGNSADDYGGGVYVNEGGAQGGFTMNDGVISNNVARTTRGGGVYISNGQFKMFGGSVIENTAYTGGGGIFIYTGKLNMTGGNISDNVSTIGNGGGVYVYQGEFIMTSGTISGNTALGNPNGSDGGFGGGVHVHEGGSATIGFEGCYGNANLEGHTSCPQFFDNKARNGGAISLFKSNPIFHCGYMRNNSATENGGAVYVDNADITLNYAVIELNEAGAMGGGIYVKSSVVNTTVTVDGGVVNSNIAENGGGIAVSSTGGYVATVIIGREGCNGTNDIHKHPEINGNIAILEGGGIWLYSSSSEGIVFMMYCGELSENAANQNVPTGNLLQEGGKITISGTYEIDNATVVNGTYLRPDIGNKQVSIIYNYGIDDGSGQQKTTIVTVAYGSNDNMKINLPSDAPYEDANGQLKVLVRWVIREGNDPEGEILASYECGSQYLLNETTVNGAESITLFAVWIVQGQGFAENPIVTPGEQFSHISEGIGAATVEMFNPFTVQFAVSDCNPALFSDRILTFNEPLARGTTIIMVDLTTSGTRAFYYYNVIGTEIEIRLTDFIKLGAPTEHWENTVTNANNDSREEFLFVFDFSRTSLAYIGALQVTLTREYAASTPENEIAPIIQIGSCSVMNHVSPDISYTEDTDEEWFVGDTFDITYTPGFIAENGETIYKGSYVAIVLSGVDKDIPSESYVTDGTNVYPVNRDGYIIIPLGAANEAHSMSFTFISNSLMKSESGITLLAKLHVTPDQNRPLATQSIDAFELELAARPLPSASITLPEGERIYYLGELPASVQVALTESDLLIYNRSYVVYKVVDGDYAVTEEIAVSEDGVLTFAEGITAGTYRIAFVVEDTVYDNGIVAVYNFVVMEK